MENKSSTGTSPPSMPLEWVGGHSVLDFVNTVHDWTSPDPEDYLRDFGVLLHWCEQAGLIGPDDRRELGARSGKDKASAFAEAIRLRENLHTVFLAAANGTAPPRVVLNDLNSLVRKTVAWRSVQLCDTGECEFESRWDFTGAPAIAVLGPIVWKAMDLLQNGPLDRIKECPPPEGCGWLFVDTSKNRSRQWCSMKTCGNLSKVRRFRGKSRS